MTVTGLGTRQRQFRLPLLALLSGGLLIAALVMFAIELTRFAQGRDRLQTDITVGGVPVTGLSISEAAALWERVYAQPVELDYLGHPILLVPSEIGFRPNSAQMIEAIRSQIEVGSNYWTDFWNYLWRRPATPIEIPLIADFSEARLRAFLEDLAARYDQSLTSAPGFDLTTMTFNPGAAGAKLDIQQSIVAIQEALYRPTERRVKLTLENVGARVADMETLKAAILRFLAQKTYPDGRVFSPDGPDTLASIGVIDLQTGQEMWINPDIAYSAMSTIKIPILINLFSKLDFAPDVDTKWLMASSIICSINPASNFLMQIPGQGANARAKLADGLVQVTTTARELGATYTFINAPIYVAGEETWSISNDPPPVPDPNHDAMPDLWSRTTAQDMAVLLHGLYDCAEYGSGFVAAMPQSFTQAKCRQMIELLSGNVINRLIELGVPPGTRVAHKNGWGGTARSGANVSDAAIVYSPGGTYILVAYMWEKYASQDGIGTLVPWEAIEGVSRIVYNYFNPTNPLTVARVPDNPLGAIDCVMPNPGFPERIDLDNIRSGRFDENGYIEPDACYGYPTCGRDPIPESMKPGQ